MISDKIMQKISEIIPENNIVVGAELSKYTTFKIGGPADCLIEISSALELCKLIQLFSSLDQPYFILGNGSNILASDKGFSGFILHIGNQMNNISVEGTKITAQSGAMLSRVSKMALDNGLTGLEFASGIPGSVGGAAIMNAGAYGGEMCQVVTLVTAVNKAGELKTFSPDSFDYSYRDSYFKKEGLIVTEVEFTLTPGDPLAIKATMDDMNAKRREKQPLEYPSAGSVFKRPEGYFAGKLIMDAGLRGFQIGEARVADKHCGFIVNMGKATSEDVLNLIAEIRDRVKIRFDVDLETEIIILQ